MIRFQPDSLPQAFMRFFDMAAPDANVYIEIAAPDIRFASIVVLVAAAALCWRRLGPGRQATGAMLLVLLLSTAVWLATTGNGRYFLPLLICAGPIAIGLICLLPITRGFKATLALLLAGAQVFVIVQQPPWNSWTFLHWKDAPYFEVRLGPEEARVPTTYATLSLISYSLIAPQFPPDSRWINLPTSGGTARDDRWVDKYLRESAALGPIRAIAPSLPWASLPDGRPNQRVLDAFDQMLARRNLRISGDCRYLASPGMLRVAEREKSATPNDPHPPGFWSCPVVYEQRPERQQRLQPPDLVRHSFQRLAQICPRFFPASEPNLLRLPDAWSRHYGVSETRVYVTDSGEVWYRFWRSMNPVFVGKTDDLLAGKVQLDCTAIRGSDGAWRSGAQ